MRVCKDGILDIHVGDILVSYYRCMRRQGTPVGMYAMVIVNDSKNIQHGRVSEWHAGRGREYCGWM